MKESELNLPVILEVRSSDNPNESDTGAVPIPGHIILGEENRVFVRTAPFRPKHAPGFYTALYLVPTNPKDAKKGLLKLLSENQPVQCEAYYTMDGQKITAAAFRDPASKYTAKDSIPVLLTLNEAA